MSIQSFVMYALTSADLAFNSLIMRRSNDLYFMVFKPHWFLYLYSFESNQVKTKWLFKRSSNHMDGKNSPSESSKGAIIGHSYSATYGKYYYFQDMLTSSCYLQRCPSLVWHLHP